MCILFLLKLNVLVPEVTSVPTNLRGIGSRLSWSFADTGLDMEAPGDLRSKLMGQQVNSDCSFVFFEANLPKINSFPS